ncbi:hypothetical protein MTBPR1_230002 [Candidatus Terasakiella magnetica]|uniref:Uncharacterized protein n=1 Tax=Candidatus Terasakiella magnetica TaxID=1867952 RepID=A0A1C3RH10_9PROT|nr:hypothetical protein MTBPR1_230002 [Candidatus Terasakiella magnetica]
MPAAILLPLAKPSPSCHSLLISVFPQTTEITLQNKLSQPDTGYFTLKHPVTTYFNLKHCKTGCAELVQTSTQVLQASFKVIHSPLSSIH